MTRRAVAPFASEANESHKTRGDFVHGKQSNGRSHEILTVLDEFTRRALTVIVRTKMGAVDVLEVPYPLLLRHGAPEHIRSDDGPEIVAEALQG